MGRSTLAGLAALLATVLVPLGITSTWLSLRVDTTPAYVDTVAPLAEDPDLREALAEEVADTTVAVLQERVPVGLPDTLRDDVRASTMRVVENEGFPEFWREANADMHRELLAIVHEEDDRVDADGFVVIDLGPLVDAVIADFVEQVPGLDAVVDVPEQTLPVPVMTESRLEEVRGLYLLLEGLALWVPLLWAALVALAVAVAPGLRGRLRTAAACAVGVAVGGGLVLLGTTPVTDLVVDQVEAERRDLARLVVDVVVDSLAANATGFAVTGLVVGAVLLVVSLVVPRRPAHP